MSTRAFIVSIILTVMVAYSLGLFMSYRKVRSLENDLGISKNSLEKVNERSQYRIDSLALEIRVATGEIERISALRGLIADSLKIERAVANKWRARYEKIKNTPAPRWTDAELDSLIGSITR